MPAPGLSSQPLKKFLFLLNRTKRGSSNFPACPPPGSRMTAILLLQRDKKIHSDLQPRYLLGMWRQRQVRSEPRKSNAQVLTHARGTHRHIHPLPVALSPLIRPSTGGKHRSRWPETMASSTMKWQFIVRIPGDNDSNKLSPVTQKPTCQDHPSHRMGLRAFLLHTSVMAPVCPTCPALNNITFSSPGCSEDHCFPAVLQVDKAI